MISQNVLRFDIQHDRSIKDQPSIDNNNPFYPVNTKTEIQNSYTDQSQVIFIEKNIYPRQKFKQTRKKTIGYICQTNQSKNYSSLSKAHEKYWRSNKGAVFRSEIRIDGGQSLFMAGDLKHRRPRKCGELFSYKNERVGAVAVVADVLLFEMLMSCRQVVRIIRMLWYLLFRV